MYGSSPRDSTPNTTPRYLADATDVLPCPNSTCASGGPSTARISAPGTTRADDSRVAAEKSLVTSSLEPSAACALILGSIAVITETPTIAYGNWNIVQAFANVA